MVTFKCKQNGIVNNQECFSCYQKQESPAFQTRVLCKAAYVESVQIPDQPTQKVYIDPQLLKQIGERETQSTPEN